MSVVLEVQNVCKRFMIPGVRRETIREHVLGFGRGYAKEELRVLEDVSFSLERGETLGLMGRNGSGKSTLLKIVAGLYRPDRGRVIAHAGITPILELGVGWNPELDAIDNVLLVGGVLGMSQRQLRAGLGEILAFAELERFAHLSLKHYSTGMAARLAYAVAFHAPQEVLILDEIFAVGDAGFRRRCLERYHELVGRGCSVLLVSHEPWIIANQCSRAMLLEDARVVQVGTGKEIADRYGAEAPDEHPQAT